MPRLFVALQIPSEPRETLAALRGGLIGARWIDPSDHHVTLRFLGDIDGAAARDFDEKLLDIRRPPMALSIDGLGVFGGDRPRALVALVRPDAGLSLLQADCERAARNVGLAAETRKYTPHVTLARLRGVSAADAAAFLESRAFFRPISFSVDRFALLSSRASVGGGPYVVEAEYDLSGGPAPPR